MKTFITAMISLAFATSGFADNHSSSSEDTNQQALAVETSICTFNDGKDISDMNKAIGSFKNWAAGTDYPSYLVMNTPLYVSLYVKEEGKKFYKGTTIRTIIDIEKAIETGEIVSKNKKTTREEAIKKLREAKDLLVIEAITQAEYDKLEKELMPIIKKEE